MSKNKTIIISAVVLLVVVGAFIIYYTNTSKLSPLKVQLTGTITSVDKGTISIEKYKDNGVDKETVEVKTDSKTTVNKITYTVDTKIINMLSGLDSLDEEEKRMQEQAYQKREEIVQVTDLQTGDAVDIQAKASLTDSSKLTAINITVVANVEIPDETKILQEDPLESEDEYIFEETDPEPE